jgi:hypothetical protein
MNINNMGHLIGNITNQTNNLCLNGKYLEKNNLSTGLSTNESNESFDSIQNKLNINNNIYEERCKIKFNIIIYILRLYARSSKYKQ